MLIKSYEVTTLDKYFFGGIRYLILALAAVSTFYILRSSDLKNLIPTLAIFITPCIFISIARFRHNVFSVITMFWLFLYIYIPLTFYSIIGDGYVYGYGLFKIPFSQDQYLKSHTPNLYFLFFCLLSAFFGLSVKRLKSISFSSHKRLKSLGYFSIILLTIVSFWIQANDIITYLVAKANYTSRGEGLLKFLFFDHAFLIIAGVTLLSLYGETEVKQIKKKTRIALLIVGLFFSVTLLVGSKAGWVQIGILFFLIPYSYLRTCKDRDILFISMPVVFFVAVMSPILYFVTVFYRLTLTTSLEFDLFQSLSYIDWDSLGILSQEIFYRLSIGGFDRFMLISTTFLGSEFFSYSTEEYLPYLLKNFTNLILPGSPYPEAYAPSSQLFSQVILKKELNTGGMDEAYLLRYMNSQPYTIFGVMTIFFGVLSPLAIFLYHYILSFLFAFFKNFYGRLTLIYFYNSAISSFGIEVAFGYAYHIIISFLFMHIFLIGFSKIKIR